MFIGSVKVWQTTHLHTPMWGLYIAQCIITNSLLPISFYIFVRSLILTFSAEDSITIFPPLECKKFSNFLSRVSFWSSLSIVFSNGSPKKGATGFVPGLRRKWQQKRPENRQAQARLPIRREAGATQRRQCPGTGADADSQQGVLPAQDHAALGAAGH